MAPRIMNECSFRCQSDAIGMPAATLPAMKHAPPTELVSRNEIETLLGERGPMPTPRPDVDREALQDHLQEALKLLHIDLTNENLRDTPRRWADSLISMT